MKAVKEKDLVVGKYYYMNDNKACCDSFKCLEITDVHITFEHKKGNKDDFVDRGDGTIRLEKEGWTYYED